MNAKSGEKGPRRPHLAHLSLLFVTNICDFTEGLKHNQIEVFLLKGVAGESSESADSKGLDTGGPYRLNRGMMAYRYSL